MARKRLVKAKPAKPLVKVRKLKKWPFPTPIIFKAKKTPRTRKPS
jgi:hypothetical protein